MFRMYSLAWAQNVWNEFTYSHPRAGNLTRVFAQMVMEQGLNCTHDMIKNTLVYCISRSDKQSVWNDFKKCAKFPSRWPEKRERALAERVAKELYRCLDDSRQRELDFFM